MCRQRQTQPHPQNDDQQQPLQWDLRKERIDLRNGGEFEGLALLAFEPAEGELCIVTANNLQSMLHYGVGQYDSAQQAMVFFTIDQDRIQLPHAATRPGVAPMPRPGVGGPQDYDRQDRPGPHDRPGMQDRPGVRGQEQLRLEQEGSRIVLRIVDDNEHIVQVYRSNPGGQATRVMEITYTRENNNND